MMLLHSHTASTPPFSLLQVFFPILLFSSLCTAEVRYFINCGSSNDTINTGQTFLGDKKSDTLHISGHGYNYKEPNQSADKSETLYQTARVFTRASSYDFNLPEIGTFFVRLHFCAFSPPLADAKFSVLTSSGHMLLTDFIPGKNSTNSPIIKEFILTVNKTGWFRIYFKPSPSPSLAFVNAIEVLSTKSIIAEYTLPYVTPAGRMGDYKGQKYEFLETIYRINVGGKEVKAAGDYLRRTWMPDDEYLINKEDAQNKSKNINGEIPQATIAEYAPPAVYWTAKELKDSLSSSKLTWHFNVNKGTKYYVRVHFCDIISPANGLYMFNLYVYGNFSPVISPYNNVTRQTTVTDTPFHEDYVVESDNLGIMNISVGPNNKSEGKEYSFLNGLEIMQVKNGTADEPRVHDNPSHLVISVVASALVLIIVVVAAVLVCLHQKKRRKKSTEAFEWGNLPLYGATSSHNRASHSSSSHASTFQNLQLGLKIPFVEIQRVTNNFDPNLIIGEGGFGKVYKGTLRSGLKVAVKRGSPDHGQGMAEFQTEIMILSKIRHRHLVSLIGYCYENGEMILVYEFMEKGTLRYHLYDSKNRSNSSTRGVLSWKRRLEICIGAAKGIQYLHTGTHKGIIHRDVKSTNILLDETYVAKVADFGLSRSGYLEQSQVSISDVKGTLGYLDPEYIICLQLTEKSDVYAFGVVLLEVLCARPVIDLSLPKEQVNLADWAMACYEEGQLDTIIDPLIAGEINLNSLTKFFETAERCLKKDATERPPMSDVCWGLEYALQLQKPATERMLLDDSTTDASLNMPLTTVRRFPSQSIADEEYNDESLNNDTGEVFSQLTFDDGTAR